MNCHKVVWNMIPSELRPNMNDAIDELGDPYNSPTAQPFRFNFENNTILKYAYFYRYFVCISNAVKASWNEFACRRSVDFLTNDKTEINVCCVGGGSGCDLVGFRQFLQYHWPLGPKVNAVILDYNDWSKETRTLIKNIDSNFEIVNFDYVRYNFLESPIKHEIIDQIQKADLISIVKLLSAVGTEENHFGFQQLQGLLSHMKQNAHVFFLDDSGGHYRPTMERVADIIGLDCVCQFVQKEITINPEESKQMTRNHYRKIPQKSICVTASLWKRH